MSTEKPFHYAHLLQVLKNIFEVLYIIFHVFMHVNSPRAGAGADNPLGSEFLYKHKPFVTLVIC